MRNIKEYPIDKREIRACLSKARGRQLAEPTVGDVDVYILAMIEIYIDQHIDDVEESMRLDRSRE